MSDDPPEDLTEDTAQPPRADDPAAAVPDAASLKGIRRQVRRAESAEEKSRRFWNGVFTTPEGRREMWGVLEAAHWSKDRFANGPSGFPDPNATFFQAGQRSIGDALFYSWLRMAPEGVMVMLDENDARFARPKGKR